MKLTNLATLSVVLIAVLAACSSKHANAPDIPISTPAAGATIDPTLGPPVVQIVDTGGGKRILTDALGKTLYVLKDDVPSSGVSKCTGDCAATWPPLLTLYSVTPQGAGLDGPLGLFRRSDDPGVQRQVTYKGKPLYRYSKDVSPGDRNGQGVEGRWSVAVP
jgi:predicted lipoprotein with Yx(FWY)xxD motif